MKKIKGSVSAIRMSHLVALFVVAVVSCLGLRTYQFLDGEIIDVVKGFYEKSNFTIPLLYGLLAGSVILFLVLSFLSKNVPAPKIPEGRNIPLGLASLVAAIGFVWDIIVLVLEIIPTSTGNTNQIVFDNYVEANFGTIVDDKGGIFVLLELAFAVLSVFYFLVFGVSHFEGKATYKKLGILSLAPGCWAMFVLISKLMKAVSFITVSELLFEIAALVFTMLFFLTFARVTSQVFSVNSMWCTYGCGFPAAIFMGLISVPRGIVLAFGKENVEGSDFSFTHLFIFIFIIVYIISTLGVGFKNALKKMRSVSNIVLPDDDEVVVKSSGVSTGNSFQELEAERTGVKKRGFTIAPEFKNISDMENFFDNDSEAETEVITKPDGIENIAKTNPNEEADEPVNIDGISESDEKDELKDLLQDIPVESISFYREDSAVTNALVENTVAEAVENYEENTQEEIEEACDEADSYNDDICPSEENPEEIGTESVEEISQIPSQTDGEDSCEKTTEATQENAEELIETFEEDKFELTSVFSEETVEEISPETEETTEDTSFEIAEEAVIEAIGETVEEAEVLSAAHSEIIEEAVSPVSLTGETSDLEVTEENTEAEKSSGGFLEFSRMLLDDSDEDEDEDDEPSVQIPREEAEKPLTVDEEKHDMKPEKVKKEKTKKEKKEKVKKEKVKKEKVKKEKPEKTPKTFGKKKKQTEVDEPLTIVSLADLRNKKD